MVIGTFAVVTLVEVLMVAGVLMAVVTLVEVPMGAATIVHVGMAVICRANATMGALAFG